MTGASSMRKKLRRKKFYASLCTKRREGVFSPSAQNRSFVHSKADCTQIAETKYITRYVQIYISCSTTILQKFLQNFCRKINCKQLSSFRLGFVKLQLRHPVYIKQQNKKGANFKEKVKITNIRSYRLKMTSSFVTCHFSPATYPDLGHESISNTSGQA